MTVTRWTPRLAPAVALALALPVCAHAQGTPEQQEACAPDAVRYCQATIPDIPKTTACMKAHFAALTPRCQAAFHDAVGGPAPVVAGATPAPKPRHARVARREALPPPAEAAPPPPPRTPAPEPPVVALPGVTALPSAPDLPNVEMPRVQLPDVDVAIPRVHVPGVRSYRAYIASACREGLIDPFTCRNTLHVLKSNE